jgi:hypothetical protein
MALGNTQAEQLATSYREAHKALAAWVAEQLDPLRAYGGKMRLTVHVDGSKVSVQVDPPPEAVGSKT